MVLHDAACCVREYRPNWLYMHKRIFSRASATHNASWLPNFGGLMSERDASYREIRATTPEWNDLRSNQPIAYATLRRAMLDSIDRRQPFRDLMIESEKKTPSSCYQICVHRSFTSKLSDGYQWSTCMNTRSFVRVVRQDPPLNMSFGTDAKPITIEPCAAFKM